MNPEVSIIIPVYNAQNYLRRCVDSVLNQEFTDFELFLVNDGSTDNSGQICLEYARKDSRVKVIQKENTGVSDSRNTALNLSSGTYIQFLDSDDWITPDATKLLVRCARDHQCDMVIADFYRVVGERLSQKGDIDEDVVLTREEFAEHMMANPADFYYGVLWNKLYRRQIIEEHHLRMNAEISWCEDFMFNLEYIRYAVGFFALKAPVYYYVKRKGSLVSQGANLASSVRMKLTVFEFYNNFYKHVFDEDYYERNRLKVYRFLMDIARDGVVAPTILPGSKKLGQERISILPKDIDGEGIIMETYRERKLLEHYLEAVALKNGLTMEETWMLLYLNQPRTFVSRKELSEFTGFSRYTLSVTLQKLNVRGLIRLDEFTEKTSLPKESVSESGERPKSKTVRTRQMRIALLPPSEPVLADLCVAQNDYDQARFQNLTEEELIQYAALSQKIQKNIRDILERI